MDGETALIALVLFGFVVYAFKAGFSKSVRPERGGSCCASRPRMRGPRLVLIPEAIIEEEEREWIREFLKTFSDGVRETAEGWFFSIDRPGELGSGYEGPPMGLTLVLSRYQESEFAPGPDHLGFLPGWEIGIAGLQDEPEYHDLVGRMGARLLSRFGGWADMGCALYPPFDSDHPEDQPSEENIREYVKGVKGRFLEVRMRPFPDVPPQLIHYADAEALGSWLKHPDYHLAG